MGLETDASVEAINAVQDADETNAHPASDERLESIRQQGENADSILSASITPDGTGATFPSQSVPDGRSVLVQNQDDADTVYVQDDNGNDAIMLKPGDGVSLAVSNFDLITVTGTSNTPQVTASVEV